MYAIIGEKATYIIFLMFLGMVNDTSKDKKWSIGANESVAGHGEGHTMCDSPSVVKSAITHINVAGAFVRPNGTTTNS